MFIHELPHWPQFTWDSTRLTPALTTLRLQQGRLLGRLAAVGPEANLGALTQDVVKSSEIEGEHLDPGQVRSSLARRLGLDPGKQRGLPKEREGMVLVLLDATGGHAAPMTKARLCGWHASLFPTGHSGGHPIRVGDWRDDSHGPMQVISGPLGRETVHFEAPAAPRLPEEMRRFFEWFEAPSPLDPLLKSAIAHLWFVTLHPFDDGNGRLARALSDLLLARSEQSSQRGYSLSWQIQRERKAYYQILEDTQKGSLDISAWLDWYLQVLGRAIANADEVLEGVLKRSLFWQRHGALRLNERQRDMLEKLLGSFEGKLTSSKWAKLQGCSQDTAIRDIQGLMAMGVLVQQEGGGRSTSYRVKDE